jgi:hypothetical protein
MPDLNAAATLKQADDFKADYATATITIYDGATELATHTLADFVTSNSGANALATANAIANDTIDADGTADSAKIIAGTKEWTLTVGTSGTEVVLSTLTYVTGETSSISSCVITFPA